MSQSLAPIVAELHKAQAQLASTVRGVIDNGRTDLPVISIDRIGRKRIPISSWYEPERVWTADIDAAVSILQGKTSKKVTHPLDRIVLVGEVTGNGRRAIGELVHQMLHAFGSPGVPCNGWHSSRFKYNAESVGLTVGPTDSRRGYGVTSVLPGSKLAKQIDALKVDWSVFDLHVETEAKSIKGSPLLKWSCGCGTNVRCATLLDSDCRKCATRFAITDKHVEAHDSQTDAPITNGTPLYGDDNSIRLVYTPTGATIRLRQANKGPRN